MKRSWFIGAVAALATLAASLPLLAADTLSWPWKDKIPEDPALAMLAQIGSVSAATDGQVISISVETMAPTPGFTDLKLVPRLGDPSDEVFAFDAEGRPPEGMVIQVLTPVSIDVAYTGAPVEKVAIIEVYSQTNCGAFSLKDEKAVGCTSSQ